MNDDPDFPPVDIEIERRFAASPARLFRAWVEPNELERWAWGSLGSEVHASVDLRVGGEFRIATTRPDGVEWAFSGRYAEIDPNRALSYTLHWDAPMGYVSAGEHATVRFAEDAGGTRVTFTHRGVPAGAREGHVSGWSNTFDALERVLDIDGS
jgi:uncharacterized protein YndB with AHSA1/START domain